MLDWTRTEKVELALSLLRELQFNFGKGRGFSMDIYTAIEKTLDNLRAEEVGTTNTKAYPNPCSEILIPSREYSMDDTWDYKEDQARWKAAGFNAYNCDYIDEFGKW